MAIQWGAYLATGIEEVDSQHRELFRRLNAFLDACDAGKETGEILGMLQFLDDYVIVHFSDEERLQEKYDYPDRARHKQYHREFVRHLADLKRRFILDGPTPLLVKELNRHLVGWLLHHIAEKDRDFGQLVAERERRVSRHVPAGQE